MDHLLVELAVEREALRVVHVGVAEDAHPVELGRTNEAAQLLEVRLRLTGEADDERRPQGDARDRGADALEQLQESVAV